MSTQLNKYNFEPISDISKDWVKDFQLADKTLASPANVLALTDGEWMTLDVNGKLIRGADLTQAAGTAAAKRSFPLWAERGRYDVQALKKAPIIWLGEWEADTRVFDASAGAGITDTMQPLMVAVISTTGPQGTRKYSGLIRHTGSAPIVALVTRLHTANGGKLRVKSAWAL